MNRKLQVGDFVKSGYPAWSDRPDRQGFIVEEPPKSRALNRIFKVLWINGEIGNNIYDYDLELVK